MEVRACVDHDDLDKAVAFYERALARAKTRPPEKHTHPCVSLLLNV